MYTQGELFDTGLQTRTEVLGEAHVKRSLTAPGDFGEPIQKFVTEIGWGLIWNRPGLDRKARSMITVAMLAALGSEHELRVHVRGALNNGVTEVELQEILLQAALYGGAPNGLAATRIARQVLQDVKAEAGG